MILIGLSGGVYLIALSRRLTSTCSMSTSSIATSGRSGGTCVVRRGLVAECLELVELLRSIQSVTVGRPDAQHAHRPTRREQRQVERRRSGQCRRAEAGRLPMLEDPSTNAEVVGIHLELATAPWGEATDGIGQEHDHLTAKDLADVPHGDR